MHDLRDLPTNRLRAFCQSTVESTTETHGANNVHVQLVSNAATASGPVSASLHGVRKKTPNYVYNYENLYSPYNGSIKQQKKDANKKLK